MKTKIQIIIILISIVTLMMATVGCGIGSFLQGEAIPTGTNETEPSEETDTGNTGATNPEDENGLDTLDEYYYIQKNENTWYIVDYWVVDRDGNTIPKDEQFTVLYDNLTNEPQCLILTKDVPDGKDEYENPISRTFSALYYLDGTLLYDWEECRYMAGFGDFLIRQTGQYYNQESSDGMKFVLWNFKTREPVMENVYWVESITDNAALLSDDYSKPICVMNRSGDIISDFPLPEQYLHASAWNGYIIGSSGSSEGMVEQHHLLTEDFEPLLSYPSLQTSFAGKVLYYEDEVEENERMREIINVAGEKLYRIPQGESIEYFDENIVITYVDNSTTYSEPSNAYHRIVDLKTGAVLSEGEGQVVYSYSTENEKGKEFFLIVKNNSIQVMNKNGWMSEEKEIHDVLSGEILDNGFVQITIHSDDDSYSNMLLDSELNEIIPMGVYDYIRQVIKWSGAKDYYGDAFICHKYKRGTNLRTVDLIDLEGNVLVGGLNEIYDSGPNRLAVRKGFEIGLMDWHGNWIVKQSIFSGLQD